MDKLAEELRLVGTWIDHLPLQHTQDHINTIDEAADRIESQAAEIEALKHDLARSMETANAYLNERESLTRRVAELERQVTDSRYMLEAYRQMLGEKGRIVAARWEEQGLIRQHTSWTVDPYSLPGEEIAETHLAWMDAPRVPIDDVATLQGDGE